MSKVEAVKKKAELMSASFITASIDISEKQAFNQLNDTIKGIFQMCFMGIIKISK